MNALNLVSGASYDTQVILKEIKNNNTNISDQRARWIFFEMEKSGYISRVNKKTYCVNPRIYFYNNQSEIFTLLKNEINLAFPLIKFAIMETRQLNEWANLLIAKNIIFIEVEKGIEDIVFIHLQEHFGHDYMILLSPNEEILSRYSTENLIVVKKLYSRAPLNKNNYLMSLEQLSVDLIVDKNFKSILGGATDDIIRGIHHTYDIDVSITKNYAKRRQCLDEFLNIWK